VDAVDTPGDGGRLGIDRPAKVLPAAPCGSVPPFAPQRAVGADGEAIEPVRPPRGHAGAVGSEAAEAFPAAPAYAGWRDLVISRFGTKDAGAGMLIPSGRTDVFRRRPERGLHLVLGERRIGLLQERDDPGSDRRRSRRAAVTVEVAGEMRDRAEVGF